MHWTLALRIIASIEDPQIIDWFLRHVESNESGSAARGPSAPRPRELLKWSRWEGLSNDVIRKENPTPYLPLAPGFYSRPYLGS